MRPVVSLALAATLSLSAAALSPARAEPRTPVLLELFSSEGCSSCPPADDLLNDLVHAQPVPGAQLVGFAEHVDYWDYLGWKDGFASPAFTARQKLFTSVLKSKDLYTPMLVVDGTTVCVGSDRDAALAAIRRAAARPHAQLEINPTANADTLNVTVSSLPPGYGGRLLRLEACAVNPKTVKVNVKAGENAGRILTHGQLVSTFASTVVDGRKVPFSGLVGPLSLAGGKEIVVTLRSADGVHVLGTQALSWPTY